MAASSVVLLDRGNNTTCTINLYGATVVSWRVNNQEQLFVSKLAVFDGKKAIRGGIPFVFPQFGPWTFGPQHGFARITRWTLERAPERLANGDVEALFSLMDNDFTRSMWNFPFRITYRLILREKELHFHVGVYNPSKDLTFSFNLLLHTYLKVPDVRKCQITGLHGCTFIDKTRDGPIYQEGRDVVTINEWTDRVYQHTPQEHIVTNVVSGRKMRIQKYNFPDTVLWNPWHDQAREMADFGDDEYPNMVCVEAGHVSSPVILLPGTAFEASQILQLGRRFLCTTAARLKQPPKAEAPNPVPMKFLNVAEKNDAAKTIAGLLSNGSAQRREGFSKFNKIYEFQHDVLHHRSATMVMTSVSGHLLQHEFPAQFRNWRTVNPLRLFEAPVHKFCPENYQPIKRTLEKEVRSATGLIIWTDCDREGENIGFEIIEVCRAIKANLPVYRAKFSEITTASVRRALAQLAEPDALQSAAVDARSELDLRIGAAFTRFQTMRFQRLFPHVIDQHLVSYGSCQIPTLGFVAKRFREVEAFQPQQFWKLRMLHTKNELTVEWSWSRHRLFDEQACRAIYELCTADDPLEAIVTAVTNKSKNKWRPVALDTIELEKLGSKKLKLSAKTTMTIAEKLYTRGFISYPRTETNSFSKEIDLRALVQQQTPHPAWGGFASRLLADWGCNPRNGSKSDAAHPPIHPTKLATGLADDEQRVYELIVRHFLACLSRDAVGAETVCSAVIGGEEFGATGLCILERNYLEVYTYDRWSAKEVHPYEVGEAFEPSDLQMRDGRTTAPDQLTEAELIAMMDKHGIGTDATHADHINTIIEREYIGRIAGGFLVPGKLGMGLVDAYEAIELPLAQPELRAGLEADLKLVCEGRRPAQQVLAEQIEIYRNAFRAIVEGAGRMDGAMAVRLEAQVAEGAEAAMVQYGEEMAEVMVCPKCGGEGRMALKEVNGSWCLACLNFPDCRHTVFFPASVVRGAKVVRGAADEGGGGGGGVGGGGGGVGSGGRKCQRCGSLLVQFRLKSVRDTVGLEQRRLQADGLTYETCVKCDTAFRDQCFIAAHAFAAGGAENARPTPVAAPAAARGRPQPTVQRPTPVQRPPPAQRPPSMQRPTATVNPVPASGSSSSRTWVTPSSRTSNPGEEEQSSWSTKPTIRPPPPPAQRPTTAGTAEVVMCSKCGKQTRRLTVRKEGPNQGREFYTCTQECNFFQWADAVPGYSNNNSRSFGSGGSGAGSSFSNPDSGTRAPPAKRKCSQCRQEGHTKKKCPQLQHQMDTF